ncbi:MAG: malto-oligosyltrehalose trehalohydrolase [Planctomycetota bacterium]
MNNGLPDWTRIGAYDVQDGQTRFRVWAPNCTQVEVGIAKQSEKGSAHERTRLESDGNGYFSGVAAARAGDVYHYRLDDRVARPDPASRFQPHGVHGDSQVIDHGQYAWADEAWQGISKRELVIYELHLGCFTEEGTYRSALSKLPHLKALGVTAIELLPVAQAPGRWNWGYDGVNLFAPNHNYGSVDELKAFVDACHAEGFAVLLDVVYNHLGPEGNYLRDFGPYFSNRYHTPWGEAVNFDGEDSKPVRDYIISNALYWLDAFHFDGLRLDAAHFLFDNSDEPILASLRNAVEKFQSQANREIHLVAEANIFDRGLLQSGIRSRQEQPYDAIWCDCLMHSIYRQGTPDVQLTRREYRGGSEIAEALRHGYLYRSQPKLYQAPDKRPVRVVDSERIARPTTAEEYESLIFALQTHDSVGNHPHGQRIHQLTSVEFQKAAAALTILSPAIPLIFMGEEQATDTPFPFFVDFEDAHLRKVVDEGRANEYPQHAWDGALSPSDERAFFDAKLTEKATSNPEVENWYRSILQIRRTGIEQGWLSKATFEVKHRWGSEFFELQYRTQSGPVLTIASNLGPRDSNAKQTKLTGLLLADSLGLTPADSQVDSPLVRGCHCLIVQHQPEINLPE